MLLALVGSMESEHPDVNQKIDSLTPGLWPRFLVVMRKAGVPAKNMQWYERWVGRFAASRMNYPLAKRTYADVRDFIGRLGASGGYTNWQLVQADHALFLFYRDIVGAPWVAQWRPLEASAEPPVCVAPGTGRSGSCTFRDHVSQADQGAQDELAARIHAEIRTRGYSWKTEATYRHWAQRLLAFSRAPSSENIPPEKVREYLEYLAVTRGVTAATQSQALNALVFLFTQVLKRPIGEIGEFARAKRPQRLPTVLSRAEVRMLLAKLDGTAGWWHVCCMAAGCASGRGSACGSRTLIWSTANC